MWGVLVSVLCLGLGSPSLWRGRPSNYSSCKCSEKVSYPIDYVRWVDIVSIGVVVPISVVSSTAAVVHGFIFL